MQKRGRPESQTYYEPLGEGGLNCIIGESDGKDYNVVHRIGRTKNKFERESMFQRADGILALLNESPGMFGPSLMARAQETEKVPFSELPEGMKNILYSCSPFKGLREFSDELVYNQVIEYLYGGDMSAPTHVEDTFESTVFMLMWFFYTTQAEYGFRHRDLKPANVVFRDMGSPTQFLFQLGKDSWYLFKTRYVPVVIDYDFASIFVTNTKTRYDGGTRTIIPPNQHITYLVRRSQQRKFVGSMFFDDTSFDWYSLGLTILRWLFKGVKRHGTSPHVHISFTKGGKELDRFEDDVVDRLDLNPDDEEVGTVLATVYCQLRTMHLFGLLTNNYINEAHLESRAWGDVIETFIETFDPGQDIEYGEMIRTLNKAIQEYGSLVNTLFPMLLSPDQDTRTWTGEPWKAFDYLFDPYPEYPTGVTTPYSYVYGIHPIFDVGNAASEMDRDRRVRLVQKMAQAMQKFHSIAGQVVCVNCQEPASHISADSGEFYCSRDCAIAKNWVMIHK